MSDVRGQVGQLNLPGAGAERSNVALRTIRDGSLINLPWIQSLVFAGRAFGIHAGSVSTPIAGHAAIDADQPEWAVRIPDGTVGVPLYVSMVNEAAGTTLAQGGMMTCISNIDVGAGTSTAATPFNLSMRSTVATTATAAVAYSGNGTDPLTAGNFLEIARIGTHHDLDAATSGLNFPVLRWEAGNSVAPLIQDAGSFLGYGEAAANTLYATALWAELDETYFQ